jgi:hypothetical protein
MFLILAIMGSLFASQPVMASTCLNAQYLEKINQPLQTSDEARELIHDLSISFRACGDMRGLFAEVYHSTLEAIQAKIVSHHFENTELVKKILVAHTNLYRKALYLEQSHHLNQAPISWRIAFQSLRSEKYKPGTLLVLSMNAHIAYDMAKTLIDLEIPFHSKSAKRDYQKITQILRDSMESLWVAFRIYDHNHLVLPKSAELKIMIEWAAWMRDKAWNDAQICSKNKNQIQSCLKSLDHQAGELALYYKKINFLLH